MLKEALALVNEVPIVLDIPIASETMFVEAIRQAGGEVEIVDGRIADSLSARVLTMLTEEFTQ